MQRNALAFLLLGVLSVWLRGAPAGADAPFLAGTAPWTEDGDPAARIVSGIHEYLDRLTASMPAQRASRWTPDYSSPAAYDASLQPARGRLRTWIGAVDARSAPEMQLVATVEAPALLGQGPGYDIFQVRWPVLAGVTGEGLLLEPRSPPKAGVVAIPDCDWSPEMLAGLEPGLPEPAQFARRLAASGCRVLVPLLLDRACDYSGVPSLRMTNQPHREFIMRLGFHLGRHIIGYEVQKILAAIDWLVSADTGCIGAFGYGEGGLLALYAAALDARIGATVVSGYFQPRQSLYDEPIYRSVWALLTEFGDAELAALAAPRSVFIEASGHPQVSGPPDLPNRAAGAPGRIQTPPVEDVRREFERARALTAGLNPSPALELLEAPDGQPGQPETLQRFLASLCGVTLADVGAVPHATRAVDREARRKRQFDELTEHTQALMRESARVRADFWKTADAASLESWTNSLPRYREYLWDEVIGRLPVPDMPPNPRSRKILDEPEFDGYEVMLDVYPQVPAVGILLVPKNLAPGERRPVVVCQHGLEGRPDKVADPRVQDPAYNSFGAALARKGYVVFAPQNPYIGGNDFRQIQRKAHPLKLTLFSFIVRQHERIIEWLCTLPSTDSGRIGFYGISYGGKTAMRLGALLPQYKVVICSGDFNEWVWKVVSLEHPFCYPFTHEYEMLEFNLANTFNHAEMSWMVLPRPFMVERGHVDGVSIDEWVAYEYARTRFLYDKLGVGENTEIEFFNGPHTIHGAGTFAFLDKWLRDRGPVPN